MKSKRIRGYSAERDLVKKLWKLGFAAIRGPASGAKVKHSVYPDVVAIRSGLVLVFEVKYRRRLETIYIPHHQVAKILEFARRAGGIPLIAVRIGELKEWRVIPVDKLELVNNMFKISREVLENSPKLHDYISNMLTRKLTSYKQS
ncbi:MAG TPA: Holliday junction resolvase [Ignisphaera sp.]|uniref:Crossover junction endodeoxyribonuclease Hjc n=1 Tax=Ignisphaera aggregans TaxID=334771 RepID=A0A833DTF3_9CREN|nr:Holliday junction resolvase [Ignisphaera sp.]HIP57217.1 Holliday junction resolvase [Ignisphaera aggregans]